jgi:hypothetical protein
MPTCKNTTLTKDNVECNTIPDKRNQNNYLKDLTVNGYTVSNFDAATLTYTINVASSSTTVEVGATAVSAKSTVSGVGTINLTSNNQKINILVTAENESTKTYTLTVTKSDSVPLAVSEIINHSGVKSDGTYISGISLNTTAATLKTKLQSPSKDASIQITSESGKEKTDSILATGDKVIIKSGNETKTYSIVIYGDTNGDGKINAQDYVKIKNYIMGNSLGSVYKEAADADKNGKVNAQDYVKVKNYIMGNTTITQ